MKKLFVLMLALMLTLSCVVIAPAAEETDGLLVLAPGAEQPTDRLVITDGSTLDFWEGETKSNIPDPELITGLGGYEYPVVTFTIKGTVHSNGGWNGPAGTTGVKIHYKPFKGEPASYDLTGMNYMHFDLYVSDPSKIEGVNFHFEMTSMKGPDKEERNWKKPLSFYIGGEVVAGWNHVELDLSTNGSDNGFRIEEWNFMRIHNAEGFEAGEDGLQLAFKDIYFTATSPKAEAAAAAAQAIIELYTPIAEIGSGDITEENYETVKAQLEAAIAAFNEADAGVRDSVTAVVDAPKIERNVSRAIEKYEAALNKPAEPEEPADEPADEPTPDAPATDDPATDAPATDDPATDAPTTDAPATDDATTGEKNDMTLYFIIGGAALLIVIVVIVVIVAKKKKK